MKSCVGCKYAEWERNAKGHLHPNGNGDCKKETKIPILPSSKHWSSGWPGVKLKVCGGHINRREEFKEHCPCYEREEK